MPKGDLRARAAATHVVVIGAGVAGLVAARECAKLGVRVTVCEAAQQPGGTVRRAELDGLLIDTGVEGFSNRDAATRVLLDELGLAELIEEAATETAWVSGVPGVGAAPLPEEQLAGIPMNPFDERVRRIIGWRGAWRAYSDRLRGTLKIGHEQSLGRLVATRMGVAVRDRLVAPRSLGVWMTHPDEVLTDAAAPGLNAALTRTGSLSGAVASLLDGRTNGPTVSTLRGGMYQFVEALVAELMLLGAELRLGTPVQAIGRSETGWALRLPESDDEDADVAAHDLTADAVIVATDETTARALLGELLPTQPPLSVGVELVTLRVRSRALDAAPRGAEVFALQGSAAASALTHSTAKWAWLADAAEGEHLLRLTFGDPAATLELDDAAAAELALAEARALSGADDLTLAAAHRERFSQALPASHAGARKARVAIRKTLRATSGLAIVGGWIAGAGLARVIPDAQAEAERLRGALLWQDADSGTSQQP